MMLDFNKKYYSKLLLFGEYTVLIGSSALSVPFSTYHGNWKKAKKTEEPLLSFLKFFEKSDFSNFSKITLDRELLTFQIENGLVFDSNIKIGCGLGSSGSLTAAAIDTFLKINGKQDLDTLKDLMAQVESYFHGKSSGIDALTIFLNKAVKSKEGQLDTIDLDQQGLFKNIYLYDSKTSRQTGPLVEYFTNEILKVTNNKNKLEKLKEFVELGIEGFTTSNQLKLKQAIQEISLIQFELFEKMIVPDVYEDWKKGLDSGNYFMKLLGAGGGGNYLLYQETENKDLRNVESIYSSKD